MSVSDITLRDPRPGAARGALAARGAYLWPVLSTVPRSAPTSEALVPVWPTPPLKAAVDVVGSALLLLLLAPLFLLIAAAIKLSDGGPVFFRQDRLGRGGRVFRIWKFRSMIVDADRYLGARGEATAARVTRVGALLRRTSLDELPQLLNIVGGDMSFVGPRPTLPSHWPRYTARQKMRARVRPGVTGLAQIRGRNTLRWSKRIRLDNFYIEHYSFLLDVRILFATVRQTLGRKDIVLDRNPHQVDDLAPPPQ